MRDSFLTAFSLICLLSLEGIRAASLHPHLLNKIVSMSSNESFVNTGGIGIITYSGHIGVNNGNIGAPGSYIRYNNLTIIGKYLKPGGTSSNKQQGNIGTGPYNAGAQPSTYSYGNIVPGIYNLGGVQPASYNTNGNIDTGGFGIININGSLGNNKGNIGAAPGSYINVMSNSGGRTDTIITNGGMPPGSAPFQSGHSLPGSPGGGKIRAFVNTGGMGIINAKGSIGNNNGNIGGVSSKVTYISAKGGGTGTLSANGVGGSLAGNIGLSQPIFYNTGGMGIINANGNIGNNNGNIGGGGGSKVNYALMSSSMRTKCLFLAIICLMTSLSA